MKGKEKVPLCGSSIRAPALKPRVQTPIPPKQTNKKKKYAKKFLRNKVIV
jgi:hypothetical protein